MQRLLLLLATIAQEVFSQDILPPQWAATPQGRAMSAWEGPSTVANILNGQGAVRPDASVAAPWSFASMARNGLNPAGSRQQFASQLSEQEIAAFAPTAGVSLATTQTEAYHRFVPGVPAHSFQASRIASGPAGAAGAVGNVAGALHRQFSNRGAADAVRNAAGASQWQSSNRGSFSPPTPYSPLDGFQMSPGGIAVGPPVPATSYSGQFGWAFPNNGFLQGAMPTSNQDVGSSQPWIRSTMEGYATGVQSHSFQANLDGSASGSFANPASAVQGPRVLPATEPWKVASLPVQQPWIQPASWWPARGQRPDAAMATVSKPQPPMAAAADASLLQEGAGSGNSGLASPSFSTTDAVPFAMLLRWLEVAAVAVTVVLLVQNFRFTCERRNSGPPADAGRNYNSTNAPDCCGGQRSGSLGGQRGTWHTGGRIESWEKIPRRPLPAGGADEQRLASLARIPRVVRDEDEEAGMAECVGAN